MFGQPEMVRTASHYAEEDETHDSSSPTESSKRGGRKINASRSKHSETEQRRRSKINERFQVLRNIIPESDQKRDKASFLLEVIQYIQFLNEKLQMYESPCQGWSPEPPKKLPLVMNFGPVESFVDQSQFDRKFSGHEENILHTALLSNAQNSLDMPPPIFGGVTGQISQGTFSDAEQVAHQSGVQLCPGRSYRDDCSVPIYAASEEEPTSVSGEASMSSLWSQGLLNSLRKSLQLSGVDLSQASISVNLNIGKPTIGASTNTMFRYKDEENGSCLDCGAPMNIGDNYEHPPKRFKADST